MNFSNIIIIILILICIIYFIKSNRITPLQLEKLTIDQIQQLTPGQLEKLTINQLKKLNKFIIASILSDLTPSQIISLDIIPITPNITNIIDNDNINNIDFSKYNPNELLFLTPVQVKKLSTSQLISICSINIHSTTSNTTAITALYNKLSFSQIQDILTSDKYHTFPFNRLSIKQFESLLKSLPSAIITKIIRVPMFLMSLTNEQYNIIISYLTDEQIKNYNNNINAFIDKVKDLATSIPSLPQPIELDSGEIDTDLETNGQLIVYLPIILFIGSPILTLKLNMDPVKIFKSLPLIIQNYLVPVKVDALYFIDPFLLNLYNNAGLINNSDSLNNTELPIIPNTHDIINYIKINNFDGPELPSISELLSDTNLIQKLSFDQLKIMTNPHLGSILFYLTPSQILSLDIISLTPNINNILYKNDISNIDFSNYKSNELLFLTDEQTKNLTDVQLKSIINIIPNLSGIFVIIPKLNLSQIETIIISNNYLFPFNKLSIKQLTSLSSSIYHNLSTYTILTLSDEKYNAIKNNFTNIQIQDYDNMIETSVKTITDFINEPPLIEINTDIDTDTPNLIILKYLHVILLLTTSSIGSRLLKLNIDPVNIFKKLPQKVQRLLTAEIKDIYSIALLDPYLINIYHESNLIK